MNKKLYDILGVESTCSVDDIKKAYKKLVLTYHPDKCKTEVTDEKFIDIHNAYQILCDPQQRKNYDSLNEIQQIEFFDKLKKYIKLKIPNYEHLIISFIDQDERLKQYINEIDLISIYSHLLTKMSTLSFPDDFGFGSGLNKDKVIGKDKNKDKDKDKDNNEGDGEREGEGEHVGEGEGENINKESQLGSDIEIDIYWKVITTYEERYLNKYKNIKVIRSTKSTKIYCIPLRESHVVMSGEGEYDSTNNVHGDIIIDVQLVDNPNYMCVGVDVYCTKYVTLHEYLYGGEVSISYIDGIFNTHFESLIEKVPLLTINGKGMPFMNGDKMERGNLHILVKIKNLDSLKDSIKKLSL